MSLKAEYDKLMVISGTSSTNEKTDLLAKFMKDPLFLKIIIYMYEETKQFKINILPMVKSEPFSEAKLFKFLDKLAEAKGVSDVDKGELAKLCSVDTETRKLVHMIINKDAKCGFSSKTINKARPDTVFSMPYCRCSTESKLGNITYPAFGQEKADGAFCNIFASNKTSISTRNGRTVQQLEHIEKLINKKTPRKYHATYHGELIVVKNGKKLNRKASNGIITSCIHGTADPEDAKCVTVQLWDAVPTKAFFKGQCDIEYSYRLKRVRKFIKLMGNKALISLIDTDKINSEAEARHFYKCVRNKGGEGAIVKNFNMIWKDHTSTNAIKLKNVSEGELRITGWSHGKKGTKYENLMGSVQCESEDGLVQVSISGWEDEERSWNWDKHIGAIISVLYESVISDKRTPGKYSLYLPRFDREGGFRFEKTVADTFDELVDKTLPKK